jgi:energy-coupling factor transport system ATP-binding protein
VGLIQIENVTFSYSSRPDVQALREMSCRIDRGSFAGITGISGAGKTSFCRLIAGYIPHFFKGSFSGEVVVGSMNAAQTTIGDLATKVGFVFENPFDQLTGASLTVLEEVAFALENMGLPSREIEARARESLRQVGLAGLADRHPQRLSGGQSQRLALASVLAAQPEILVLDEPTSQLDPLGVEEVLGVVARMHNQGYTILIVSQDLERIAPYLDRLIVMDEGRIRWDGHPGKVLLEAAESGYPLSVPTAIEVGLYLRRKGLVGGSKPLPLTLKEVAAELSSLCARSFAVSFSASSPPEMTASAEKRPPIVLEDVFYTYPRGEQALRGISLTMDSGCICIVGQNGAGKTTLLKHLNGLLKPTGGRVLVRGKDTKKHRIAQLAKDVGLAFQNPDDQLFSTTVEEEVRFGAVNVGWAPEKVEKLTDKAIQLMGIEEVREMNPYILGLPWRKRVATASVIAMDTPIVVLDEPTGGQDAPGVALLGKLVNALVAEGKLVVVVTHDIEFARKHADRVIALYQGRVLLDGEPREVFRAGKTLARTHVHPPSVTQLGFECGLRESVLSTRELFAAVGMEKDLGGENDQEGNNRL